jgi:WD40 repeat protein
VIIYNYGSYRQEGILSDHEGEVKICKFLNPYDILCSADLEGKIYFWAVTPSTKRNDLLCVVKDDNESDVGTIENFPVRAMDFDEEKMILFTGDEMGYMHKWELSVLINKVQKLTKKEVAMKTYAANLDDSNVNKEEDANTFLTGVNAG